MTKFSVAGDGSALASSANGNGKRSCECLAESKRDCQCPLPLGIHYQINQPRLYMDGVYDPTTSPIMLFSTRGRARQLRPGTWVGCDSLIAQSVLKAEESVIHIFASLPHPNAIAFPNVKMGTHFYFPVSKGGNYEHPAYCVCNQTVWTDNQMGQAPVKEITIRMAFCGVDVAMS